MKLNKRICTLLLTITIPLATIGCSKQEKAIEINISAASSLKEVMEELEIEYTKDNKDVDLVVNFGGSGSLQRQIEQGAPCDIFISAGISQMDKLKEGGYLEGNIYEDLVGNDLVLVTNENSKIKTMDDLSLDTVKHIGMGEPSSVPAGKYADEVLDNLDIKQNLSKKLVFAKDVKEVLAWTKSGNADAGFVYYSDAINTSGMKIIEKVPSDTHSPITYPVAIIKNSKNLEDTKKLKEFLLSEKAQIIFEKYGYKSTR